jgi:hypothetical protein
MPGQPPSKTKFKPKVEPTVVVQLAGLSAEVFRGISEVAAACGWRLVDPSLTRGALPGDIPPPKGAIVAQLPDAPASQRLLDLGIPVVRLGNLPHPLDHLMPPVIWDHFATSAKLSV